MKLTVAIPTFNRNEILRQNLIALLPQMDANCELLIIDNCSVTPVADTLNDLVQQYSNIKIRFLRNRANIGSGANILRCFEYCTTDWLWILGDDDRVSKNAIKTVICAISKNKDAVFINFLSNVFSRTEINKVHGIDEFIDKLDHFANFLCISVNVFQVSKIIKYLKYGFQYCYSCGPHIALMLRGLGDNEQVIFSNEAIISKISTSNYSDYWSAIPVALGLDTLIENVNGIERKKKLSRKISDLSFRVTYELLIFRMKGTISHKEMIFYYKQIMYRRHYFGHRSMKAFIYSIIYRICLALGLSGIRLLNWYCDKKCINRIIIEKFPF